MNAIPTTTVIGCFRRFSRFKARLKSTSLRRHGLCRKSPQFEGCLLKQIRAQDDDILRYVNGRIPKLLRSKISKYPDLQNTIRNEVVKSAEGMYVSVILDYSVLLADVRLRFLLAQLHMDSLSSKLTPGGIKEVLWNMPHGIKGLDVMYEEAMKRINGQEEEFRDLAKQVLSWVTHTKRPLTTVELQHAVAVRDGAVELDKDFVPDIEDLTSVCVGLVTIEEQSDIIRWIHYTTQEYIELTWTVWLPQAQVDIATTCIT
jgi:hypothetical protein